MSTDYNARRATRIARESHEYMRRRQGQYTCQADPLNPCWDNRPTDVVGKHWGGEAACANCITRASLFAIARRWREHRNKNTLPR